MQYMAPSYPARSGKEQSKSFFRSPNHRGESALQQIMQTRVEHSGPSLTVPTVIVLVKIDSSTKPCSTVVLNVTVFIRTLNVGKKIRHHNTTALILYRTSFNLSRKKLFHSCMCINSLLIKHQCQSWYLFFHTIKTHKLERSHHQLGDLCSLDMQSSWNTTVSR